MRFSVLIAVLLITLSGTALAQDPDTATPSDSAPLSNVPDSNANAAPSYNAGIRMGTSFCPDASFDCDNVDQSAVVEAANQCVDKRFGLRDKPMATFQTSGEYENCVVPSATVGVWAICCVKKSGTGQCQLYCTRYINNH